MLDSALDILFDSLESLKQEQIYLAKVAGRGEDKLRIFKRRFVKFEGNDAKVVVQSTAKAKREEEELRDERKTKRTERIFALQSRIYEIQSAIDIIKSLEDAGPEDAIEFEVGTAVDDNGNPIRIDSINPYAYNGEGE